MFCIHNIPNKRNGLRGRNFCPLAGFGRWVGVRLSKATTQIRIQRRGFVQSRFEFCPKDTASQKKRLLAHPLARVFARTLQPILGAKLK